MKKLWFLALLALVFHLVQAQDRRDSSSHRMQFVTVEKDVKLEVLDWGGVGRPLVFLSGLGNDAHIYDSFAPEFTAQHHVYGITRRGFGASSKPAPIAANYTADRLGDDVLAVINALKLERPILVGHSIAGEELSFIGNRHPEKVAGLIYLDAADAYGYYDRFHGDWMLDMIDLRQRIDALQSGATLDQKFGQDMLTSVTQFEKDLQGLTKRMALLPPNTPAPSPPPPIGLAIRFGEQKYTQIHAPVLAIFACPHNFSFDPNLRNHPAAQAAMVADDRVRCTAQANAFEAGVPSAQVVRIPDADHYIFHSNEADVIRAMNSFLATLH